MSNPDPKARVTGATVIHRLRKVTLPTATIINAIENVMHDNELTEISISSLLALQEFELYGNPNKAIDHLVKNGFMYVSRKEFNKKMKSCNRVFSSGYRYFALTPRGQQIADDMKELQSFTALCHRQRNLS